jgi:copper homeostasis protein
MQEFKEIAAGRELTCHRAVDVSREPLEVMEQLIAIGFNRILTSGCKDKALDGIENIAELVAAAKGRIQIMAGSGVNPMNCLEFVQIGVDAIHLSARTTRNSEMEYRRPGISMGGVAEISEFEVAYSSEEIIRAAISKIQDLFSE